MKTYIATGNTYNSKEDLKKSGFTFNATTKEWYGTEDNYNEFKEKYCSIKYCGARASKNATIKFIEK